MQQLNFDLAKTLPINEIYPCVQGEGRYLGHPSILIRFTGCKLRCQFASGNLCDTYTSSWTPEKGKYSLEDVMLEIAKNPNIRHAIISGGGPTMQGQKLVALCQILHDAGLYVTMETEGSEYVEGCHVDVLSLSPKLKSSIPKLGYFAPEIGREITQRDIDQHEKWRCNYDAMAQWILNQIRHGREWYLKFVVCDQSDLDQVDCTVAEISEAIINILDNADSLAAYITNADVYLMPEGVQESDLQSKRQWLIEKCIVNGYTYTDRLHIIAYGKKRYV